MDWSIVDEIGSTGQVVEMQGRNEEENPDY